MFIDLPLKFVAGSCMQLYVYLSCFQVNSTRIFLRAMFPLCVFFSGLFWRFLKNNLFYLWMTTMMRKSIPPLYLVIPLLCSLLIYENQSIHLLQGLKISKGFICSTFWLGEHHNNLTRPKYCFHVNIMAVIFLASGFNCWIVESHPEDLMSCHQHDSSWEEEEGLVCHATTSGLVFLFCTCIRKELHVAWMMNG